MKIHFDKSDTEFKRGLSPACLRDLLAGVPAEWLADVAEVRVSRSLVPANSRCWPGDASFSPYDQRLTIFAREHTTRQLVVPILSALAAHHLGFSRRRDHQLSAADAKRVSQIIAPHTESIIRRLTTRSSEQRLAAGVSS